MKKFPRQYQYPLMISMVLPSMLFGMPAIMAYRHLPEGMSFFDAWMGMLGQVLPAAAMLLAIVAPIVRLFVTQVLLQPAANATNS
ncbi:DUF2798 domain-containing protein [Ferrimonas lipolytica]|uniref:DUF2798 domain-containing protein n=1 Tax=Ferrimonas lipolytica TaxID=2724191 RepID=A0A6H1UB10_9GAMM|nr:DUF2798 domain-containing protein [Ferrimonas lipolytica]QIZ75770.1 DUF2798 domain-containing protein [Ferrimonas lipolytica]